MSASFFARLQRLIFRSAANASSQAIELLREHQFHRPPLARVATEISGVMLRDPQLEARARVADVVAAVAAPDDVDVDLHLSSCRPSWFETARLRVALLTMRGVVGSELYPHGEERPKGASRTMKGAFMRRSPRSARRARSRPSGWATSGLMSISAISGCASSARRSCATTAAMAPTSAGGEPRKPRSSAAPLSLPISSTIRSSVRSAGSRTHVVQRLDPHPAETDQNDRAPLRVALGADHHLDARARSSSPPARRRAPGRAARLSRSPRACPRQRRAPLSSAILTITPPTSVLWGSAPPAP